MQAFADRLGVSRITVWKALNERPGVSPQNRRRIIDAAIEQGLIAPPPSAASAPGKRVISVAVSRPDSSLFWMQIIHHIAKELAYQGVDLMYTYLPGTPGSDYALPDSLGKASGIIVLNVYDPELLLRLSQLSPPKVFLDTVPSLPFEALSGDLVLLEGRSITRRITERMLEAGLLRLGFLGDIRYAQTNLDRYQGFMDAHAQRHLTPDPRFSFTGPIAPQSYYEEIGRFMDQLDRLPDGFVCASDYVAHIVQRRLNDTGRETPVGFALAGFDNNEEYDNIARRITTADVQTATLGNRLARRILFLADFPQASREVSYIDSAILFRGVLKP